MENALHSHSFAQATKPTFALDTLLKHYLPASTPLNIPAGTSFQFSPDKEQAGVILFLEGIGSLCHSENGLHMSTIFPPSIVGLSDSYSLFYDVPSRPQHYFQAETDCVCSFLPLDAFIELNEKYELWHDIARILAHRLMVMSIREQELVGVDSYLKVRSLLLEIWIYPEKYRTKINVLSFVLKRTGLSRSRVLAIL
ncbi:helix-turn-helix domain-containing protein, partial [Serratia marcescens]|uniref:helix-turn-helix domain-containing protein n=1 Tax=Serratia marcescens TaxID=615 RepID=UPI0021CCF328